MKTLLGLFGIGALCLSFSGCMARIMDFTLISTKNLNLPGERGSRVQGEDMNSIIIFIPTGQPNIKTAVDRAIENGHGDALVDGVISQKFWYIPYVYGQAGFVVEGTVIDTSKAPKTAAPGVAGRAAPASAAGAASGAAPAASSYNAQASAPASAPEEPPPSAGTADGPAEAPRGPKPPPVTEAQAAAELLP